MRCLYDVITQMLEKFPRDEHREMVSTLEHVRVSVEKSSPELVSYFWIKVAEALNTEFPKLETDWQNAVFKIFVGKS